jgi:hypothetical protein
MPKPWIRLATGCVSTQGRDVNTTISPSHNRTPSIPGYNSVMHLKYKQQANSSVSFQT